MIRKAVIAAGGLGTRLLPMSKEFPKEMLPIYLKDDEYIVLKPLLQAVFEQLYRYGIRNFCFIVGRGKRAIEDHFTPDWDYIKRMENKVKKELLSGMLRFYEMVEDSKIVWVNQPEPKGFGHAILMAKPFVSDEKFIACAGDTFILSDKNDFLNRMVNTHIEYNANSTLLIHKVSDPRKYGVAIVERLEDYAFKVIKVLEKPQRPPSNIAIIPYYVFNPNIMEALERLKPGVNNEIQLTDAIQTIIDNGGKVLAISLDSDEIKIDIGTPETYWEALSVSYNRYFNRSSLKSMVD